MEIKKEETAHVRAGKPYPVKITRRFGHSKYAEGVHADEYHKYDYGTNQGITRVYIHYPDNETQDHHDKCINELKSIAGKTYIKSYCK